MSDGELRTDWRWTAARYAIGPVAMLVLMIIGIVRFGGLDPKTWQEEPLRSFQTAPEGPEWQKFSRARLTSLRQSGPVALVHFVASWSPESMAYRATLCGNRALRRLVDAGQLAVLLCDVSSRDPADMAILEALGTTELPVVALYGPPADDPVVLKTPVDEAELLAVHTALWAKISTELQGRPPTE